MQLGENTNLTAVVFCQITVAMPMTAGGGYDTAPALFRLQQAVSRKIPRTSGRKVSLNKRPPQTVI